jgi:hypothetical protein
MEKWWRQRFMELTSLVSSRAPTHSRKAAAFKSWLDIGKDPFPIF